MSEAILEIEYVVGEDYKIVVKSNGEILAIPLHGKEMKPIHECAMPGVDFWRLLSKLIKNMNERVEVSESSPQVCLAPPKKMIIGAGMSKKGMFAAGVVFGKSQRGK